VLRRLVSVCQLLLVLGVSVVLSLGLGVAAATFVSGRDDLMYYQRERSVRSRAMHQGRGSWDVAKTGLSRVCVPRMWGGSTVAGLMDCDRLRLTCVCVCVLVQSA
jgi:hypothetical protein